jgi:hypothetical protein
MNTYEFHGSIRIDANTMEEAEDILSNALSGYDLHINDAEEV